MEREIEEVASRAAAREVSLARIIDRVRPEWWPRWTPANAKRRLSNQLNPRDAQTPLQARVWFEVLADTGDDEMLDQAIEAHRRGTAARMKRDHDRLTAELDQERRRPRLVRPGGRVADTG
ncbi:MAG: hypothetical protein NXI30_04410 [bacterium]|nr:hypothetical protein [bacterium]